VTYRFIDIGGPFRIEVMNITRGISPAHIPAQARLGLGEEAVVMHVSYKPVIPGIEGYDAEKFVLRNKGLEHIQECRSTYGIFSYWLHPDLPDGVYLKPRVNLRDPVDNPLSRITEEQFIPASERVETDTLR
jgi:hypothetical protein